MPRFVASQSAWGTSPWWSNTHYRSDQSDLDNDRPSPSAARRYAFGRTANADLSDDSVPLFLSRSRRRTGSGRIRRSGLQPQRRFSLSFKLLMTASAAACVAVLFALVHLGCHARRHGQRESVDRDRAADSVDRGAGGSEPAGRRPAHGRRRAVEGSGAGEGSRALADAGRARERRSAPAGRDPPAVARGDLARPIRARCRAAHRAAARPRSCRRR